MTKTKPYFLNMRHAWEFPWWKKILWRALGKKTAGTSFSKEFDCDCAVEAYTFLNITYVSKVELL